MESNEIEQSPEDVANLIIDSYKKIEDNYNQLIDFNLELKKQLELSTAIMNQFNLILVKHLPKSIRQSEEIRKIQGFLQKLNGYYTDEK